VSGPRAVVWGPLVQRKRPNAVISVSHLPNTDSALMDSAHDHQHLLELSRDSVGVMRRQRDRSCSLRGFITMFIREKYTLRNITENLIQGNF